MPEEALTYHFDEYVLDIANRQLYHGETRLDLSGRYLDALLLLVQSPGQLVTKEQFFDDVWHDVVVSDAALTQCIKAIRKQLDDDATNPRFVETVPRHGYRFIGTVTTDSAAPRHHPVEAERAVPSALPLAQATSVQADASAVLLTPPLQQRLRTVVGEGVSGTLGGALAGVLGGLLYGIGLSASPSVGVASLLLVLIALNVLVGTVGGLGVSFGMAIAGSLHQHVGWRIAGAALGGLFVGSLAKLLSIDAFTLLFGQAPAGITGGLEGAVLGAALALGAHVGRSADAPWWRPAVGAGLAGCGAGLLIPLAGGRLMGGSLELLARSFTDSRLELDALGRFFGEVTFGPTTNVFLGGLEGLFFGTCVVGVMAFARKTWPPSTPH